MASADTAVARPPREGLRVPLGGAVLARGTATLWISLIVLLPLAAVLSRGFEDGLGHFWDSISAPEAQSAIKLTLISSLIVVAINAVMGTLIAWVLVRDEFPGKRIVNSVIDLPFALPTIVAGLTLLALYGQNSPVGVHLAYTRAAVVAALLFVTLPFVVRAVQPVLLELDREMEEAAASLGAPNHRIFRSIVLPNLTPAIVAGCGLAFARAIGEFGSLVLLTGNIPFNTQVASVYIFGRVETNDLSGAAAVSVFLLAISVGLLFALNLFANWRTRHERV
ncbi:MAG TPA: sulfate ABC transporter permease subunit CysT [Solirubrobacterales bacterium]|nr:sulfate ABC transporter permease subunit CysT [Solirubrobacterales bacterium]